MAKKKRIVHVRLLLDVDYECPSGTTDEECRATLLHLAGYAADRGLLSGDTLLEVVDWTANTLIVD